jgi:hypothetical protein
LRLAALKKKSLEMTDNVTYKFMSGMQAQFAVQPAATVADLIAHCEAAHGVPARLCLAVFDRRRLKLTDVLSACGVGVIMIVVWNDPKASAKLGTVLSRVGAIVPDRAEVDAESLPLYESLYGGSPEQTPGLTKELWSLILDFLPARSRIQVSWSSDTFAQVKQLHKDQLDRLRKGGGSEAVEIEGCLPESEGRPLFNLIDCTRFALEELHLSDLGLQGPHEVADMRGSGRFSELGHLNAKMYTNWSQVYAHVLSGAEEGRYNLPGLSTQEVLVWVKDEMGRWFSDRVSGCFWVLDSRADGSILAHIESKKVYRVQGFGSTISKMVPLGSSRRPPIVRLTLLPFRDTVVYDGLLSGVDPANLGMPREVSLKRAKGIRLRLELDYLEACEDGTLITSLERKAHAGLPPVPPQAQPAAPSAAEVAARDNLQRSISGLEHLGGSAVNGCWVFRRLDYTEEENPNHLIMVMAGSMPVSQMCTAALAPTAVEIMNGLREAAAVVRAVPSVVAIDHEQIVAPLRVLLGPLSIHVGYYPPPSEEEAAMTNSDRRQNVVVDRFDVIQPGAMVMARGLVQAADLNGAIGRVVHYDSEKGRYAVEIPRQGSAAEENGDVQSGVFYGVYGLEQHLQSEELMVKYFRPVNLLQRVNAKIVRVNAEAGAVAAEECVGTIVGFESLQQGGANNVEIIPAADEV